MASKSPNTLDAPDGRIVAEGYEEVKGVLRQSNVSGWVDVSFTPRLQPVDKAFRENFEPMKGTVRQTRRLVRSLFDISSCGKQRIAPLGARIR